MNHQSFALEVNPRVPKPIARLTELSRNFWFSWHRPTRKLFNWLDRKLWWESGRNPIVFLRCVDAGILKAASEDETFLAAYRKALDEYDSYHAKGIAAYKPAGLAADDIVAYFCAEYGLHESFPMYSGGLGVLAGDHCKAASDMRLPFVAVGLLYKHGYFIQRIAGDGAQLAEYPDIDRENTPVEPVLDGNGNPVIVSFGFPGRDLSIRVWRLRVGRITLLLLDTDVDTNTPDDRDITRALYGGSPERRFQQEIVLGIGGVRALRALGYKPAVWHMNEGHSALLVVERVREFLASGLSFSEALEAVASNTVFTTHTPVAAGHDRFPRDLVAHYFQEGLDEFNISLDTAMGIADEHGQLNMTRLAIVGARFVNGVSRIHGRISAELCAPAWPDVPAAENPVGYVTNGVHVPTFIKQEWVDLLDAHLGPSWRLRMSDETLLKEIENIPDEQYWHVNQRIKTNMLTALRDRLERQYARNAYSEAHSRRLLRHIDPANPNVLTIVFARRFATYKRATLALRNLEWLRDIVRDPDRPVVLVFAGKAHPADEPGQNMIREIHRVCSTPEFESHVLLVEGYDQGLARLLTAGADVWLNLPIYPLEASGTSGMKAAVNGTINLSVLDGWWAEAFDGTNGWAIPPSPDDNGSGMRDEQDAITFYETLQDDLIPKYYDWEPNSTHSRDWVRMSKRSMSTIMPRFNSRRVLHDYAVELYGPAAAYGKRMRSDDWQGSRRLADWKHRVRSVWSQVTISVVSPPPPRIDSDAEHRIDVDVDLAGLSPDEVRVELVVRRELNSELPPPERKHVAGQSFADGVRHLDDETIMVLPLTPGPERTSPVQRYFTLLKPTWCGRQRIEIRAVPVHPLLAHPYETGLMRWA